MARSKGSKGSYSSGYEVVEGKLLRSIVILVVGEIP
jgi:hypothetical protein